jgi:hypothetical protein
MVQSLFLPVSRRSRIRTFKDEMVNFNQSRDDIFNIYMNGYTNSREVLFKNYNTLPGIV